jgi:hypothetical protein
MGGTMLPRLILLAIQLMTAWVGAPYIMRSIPALGSLRLFVYGVVVAAVVWTVGLVLSQALRDTAMPSSATLLACLIVALIGAALMTWLPAIAPGLGRAMQRLPPDAYPRIGAVLGYHARR